MVYLFRESARTFLPVLSLKFNKPLTSDRSSFRSTVAGVRGYDLDRRAPCLVRRVLPVGRDSSR